jgi:hypothetical protein
MAVACDYPNCREIATMMLVIELGRRPRRSSLRLPLCDRHAEQAQAIAWQHDAIAYRLHPI